MPELPEVETTLKGIQPYIENQRIKNLVVRHYGLRWPIQKNISQILKNKVILKITRRAKYLLFQVDSGVIILHLGMSGSLRLLTKEVPPKKHDHVDIVLSNNMILRFTDPRRFGALLWADQDPALHPLLKNLGPEPFDRKFSGAYLWQVSRKRNAPIKALVMNNKIVVGVGNIYATEALFLSEIHPEMPANQLSKMQCQKLVAVIKQVLRKAIKAGGTTLKDFVNSDGKPGYFTQYLKVYGRAGMLCVRCHDTLKSLRVGQRSTVYCPTCQKK